MTFIVSLKHFEAQEEAERRGLVAGEWLFVSGSWKLRGLSRMDDVIYCGKWFMRQDKQEILDKVAELSTRHSTSPRGSTAKPT